MGKKGIFSDGSNLNLYRFHDPEDLQQRLKPTRVRVRAFHEQSIQRMKLQNFGALDPQLGLQPLCLQGLSNEYHNNVNSPINSGDIN